LNKIGKYTFTITVAIGVGVGMWGQCPVKLALPYNSCYTIYQDYVMTAVLSGRIITAS
jgi:hypothetical protein